MEFEECVKLFDVGYVEEIDEFKWEVGDEFDLEV